MKSLFRFLQNLHFWFILVMFIVGIILHYPQYLPFIDINTSSLIGLSRHAVERIFLLLPIVYASYVMGLKWGLVCLLIAFALMLPRAIFVSPYPSDALFEVGAVTLIGILLNWWFESSRREKGRREQALLKLEAMQRELQSHIQVIRDSEKYMSIINAISKAVSGSLELNQVLNITADKVMGLTDIDALMLFTLCEDSKELLLKLHRGVSEEFVSGADRVNFGEGFNGWVAQSGEPLLVEDASSDPRLSREVVKREGIKSQYIVPLKSKDKVVGTLCVALRRIKQFTSWEKDLLAAIGAEIGVYIENARLYQECWETGERARISEKRYRELFEKAHDAIWVQDLEGTIIAVNKACDKLMGFDPEEAIGKKTIQFLAPEALDLARNIKRDLLNGADVEQPYEQRIFRKDGSEAILKLTTTPIGDEEGIKYFQHIARDVTEEKKLQENLRFYIQQITKAQEEERERIARELHDDTAQALIALSRRLDSFTLNTAQLPEKTLDLLQNLQEEIIDILQGVRRFSQDLRPPLIDYLGLMPALRELVSQIESQYHIGVNLKMVGQEKRFSPEKEIGLYRIAQEALRNVGKHSEANEAEVIVNFTHEKVQLKVADNGIGFKSSKNLDELARIGKLGLVGIKERASLLEGNLMVQSEPGKGTKLIINIPIA